VHTTYLFLFSNTLERKRIGIVRNHPTHLPLELFLVALSLFSAFFGHWLKDILWVGLYVTASGIDSEIISLQRKFGQYREDNSSEEHSDLLFYEYVEAVKLTGDNLVPAGQV